ncbi:hypothetical protein [Salinibacter ruber]|uniref:hypothetical protein n=1 Tax=Salinibacter ruber TaxID=146919 RepID=UPI002073DF73|nr:hypothetical protein [Salinibacter ruber]
MTPDPLQHRLEKARISVGELLEDEVEKKTDERYSHNDRHDSQRDTNPENVRAGEKKMPIPVS